MPSSVEHVTIGKLEVSTDGSYGQSDMTNFSGPDFTGLGSASVWPQSSFLEPSNTCGNIQPQVSTYQDHSETYSAAFDIGSGVPQAYLFGSCELMDSNTFETPSVAANQAFPLESRQAFGIIDLAHGSTRLHNVGPTSSISRDADNSTSKRHKTSVLPECRRLPTMEKSSVMEEIAEDTAFSCEYVFHSYRQYRQAAKGGRGLLDTSSTRDSGIASMDQFSSSINFDLSKGSNPEESTANDEPSQDIPEMGDQGEKPPDSLDHTGLDKRFRCAEADCNMSFPRPAELNRHSKKHLPGEYPYVFLYCGKVFYRKDKLRQHWEKEHRNSPLPSSLNSSRPRKDYDQDGNSRSNGSSRSEPPGWDGKSSGRSSNGRSSHTSGSSGSSSAPGVYNGSSRVAKMDKMFTDCKNDVDRETEENIETASLSIHRSDVDDEVDVDSFSSIAVSDNAKNEQPGKKNGSSALQKSPSNDLVNLEETHGGGEYQPTPPPLPSSTDLQDSQQSSLPDRKVASECFQSVHAASTRSRNDQCPIRSRLDSQKIFPLIDHVIPLKVLYKGMGDSLKDQLHSARKQLPGRPHHFFIPISAVKSLITAANVEKDIQSGSLNIKPDEIKNVAEEACRYARNVFAVLAYMKKGSEIFSLLKDGVSNKDLPLTRKRGIKEEYMLQRTSGVPIKTFESWNYYDIEEFDRIQWWMIAPVFEEKRHHELNDSTILPFIPFETNAETEEKKGGFSEVYAVRIHPAHHNFWKHSESEEDEPLVAVKRLYSSDQIEFEREVTILNALGSKQRKHPHLIRLLATFRHERKYHLMFPYADTNLRKYWENRPSPNLDEATVLWVLKQMAGIASALSMVHNFVVTHSLSVDGPDKICMQKDTKLSVQKEEERFGRHGDIKPENFLWFQKCPETEDEQGILQIADFGLGRFHGRDSRSIVPPENIHGSPTYEPPECKLQKPVSRAYDIWSLGCLYLEFITWLLKGSAAIDGFSDFRGETEQSAGISDDKFFTIVKDTLTGTDAVVRWEVVTWVRQLHEHKNCSALIHDLLNLIMKGVLVINPTERVSARFLFQQLNVYLIKAKNDEDYFLKPVP